MTRKSAPPRHTGARPLRRDTAARQGITLRARLERLLPWTLLFSAVLAVLVVLIYLPGWMARYPIRRVQVEGVADGRRQAEIRLALAESVSGENFFSVPLGRVHDQVASLAWVRNAEVRREWPGTVAIRVDERVPVAVWNNDELISAGGKPFKALAQYSTKGLPHLSGPGDRLDDVMNFYHSMSKILRDMGQRIQTLDVNARLTSTLTLDNGLQLVVDRRDYARKLRRFVRLYNQVLSKDSRGVARVDLRYADGMAVTWKDSQSLSGSSPPGNSPSGNNEKRA